MEIPVLLASYSPLRLNPFPIHLLLINALPWGGMDISWNIPQTLTLTVAVMSLVSLVSHTMHLHSLRCCWFGTFFACVDLKETGVEAAEWSQGGS